MFGLDGLTGTAVALFVIGATTFALFEFVKTKVLPMIGWEMPRAVKVFAPVVLATVWGYFQLKGMDLNAAMRIGLGFLAGTKASWLYNAFWKKIGEKGDSA